VTSFDQGWLVSAADAVHSMHPVHLVHLVHVTRAESPNFDARSDGARVELIVLHHISLPADEFSGNAVIDLFQNRLDESDDPRLAELKGLRVSAHFFLRRDGEVIQCVSVDDRAWHAGKSAWRGRAACNDFSVGIEIEGNASAPFTDAQYDSLNTLIDALAAQYPIAALTSHSEIAPGRKIDPGPTFDWARLTTRFSV
jgi:N-acetyl-anhydromuramoyl-L-alanine amidase